MYNHFVSFFQDLHYQQQQYEHQLLEQQQQRSSQPEEHHRYYQHNAKSLEFTQYKNLQKQHFIKNNLNNHVNYSSNNFNNRKSVLYELKQYENFTNDSSVIDNNSSNLKNQNSNYNNYNNNILNYNNNYYKINNNLSSQNNIRYQTEYSYKQDKYNNSKMHREETQVERSHLVDGRENMNTGNVVIHNFTNNNIINQNNNTNIGIEDEEEQNNQNSTLHRSQHFTQVGTQFNLHYSVIL